MTEVEWEAVTGIRGY